MWMSSVEIGGVNSCLCDCLDAGQPLRIMDRGTQCSKLGPHPPSTPPPPPPPPDSLQLWHQQEQIQTIFWSWISTDGVFNNHFPRGCYLSRNTEKNVYFLNRLWQTAAGCVYSQRETGTHIYGLIRLVYFCCFTTQPSFPLLLEMLFHGVLLYILRGRLMWLFQGRYWYRLLEINEKKKQYLTDLQ